MTSSGGGKTSTTVQKSEPPAWAVPFYKQGLERALQLSNQPFQAYTGPFAAGPTGAQTFAAGLAQQQATDPRSALQYGNAYTKALLSGQGQFEGGANPYLGQTTAVGRNPYAGSNRYLQRMIDTSSRDLQNKFTQSTVPNQLAQFASAGAFGGTAQQQALQASQSALAQELGDVQNQYRFQDYQTQQALAESALDRGIQARQTDLARNAGLSEAALGREQDAYNTYLQAQSAALGQIQGLQEAQMAPLEFLARQGTIQQSQEQEALNRQYDEFLRSQGWATQQFNPLIQGLSAIQGGNVSTTGANPNYRSGTQNALTAAAIMASFLNNGG